MKLNYFSRTVFFLVSLFYFPVGAYATDSPLNFYDLSGTSIEGKPVSFSDYKGKVLVVVNTASKCGFTAQYADLQKLYDTFKDKGVVVLGFPSNDFANQEPGTDAEIQSFCKLRFGVNFPLFARNSVTGDSAQPAYKFLINYPESEIGGPIKWNFEKFVIDQKGVPQARFGSFTNPLSTKLVEKVQELIGESPKSE